MIVKGKIHKVKIHQLPSQEEFEDTKVVIRIRIWKNRQHNGQKDKTIYKSYNKTKDRVTRTPLKTGGELRCSGRVSSSCSTSGTRHIYNISNSIQNKTLNFKYELKFSCRLIKRWLSTTDNPWMSLLISNGFNPWFRDEMSNTVIS